MMRSTPPQIQNETGTSEALEKKNTKVDANYNIIDEIKKIQALKQGTFESSSEFNLKRVQAITELRNKVRFFAHNASQEYSAGTAKMKSYDADKEKMQLSLNWKDKLKSVFSEIGELQFVSLDISRKDAKALFEKSDKHHFHIDMSYSNAKLIISKMSIYDQYNMHKIAKESPPAKVYIEKKTTKFVKYENSTPAPNVPAVPPEPKTSNYIKFKVVNVASWDTLNVRTNPYATENNKVGELLPYAKNIHRIKCKFNYKGVKWCYIKYYEQNYTIEGWVVARCLVKQNPFYTATNRFRVVHIRSDDTLSVRNGPGTHYRKIGDLPFNARGVSLGACQNSNKGGKWCVVAYGNLRGWASKKYLRRQ